MWCAAGAGGSGGGGGTSSPSLGMSLAKIGQGCAPMDGCGLGQRRKFSKHSTGASTACWPAIQSSPPAPVLSAMRSALLPLLDPLLASFQVNPLGKLQRTILQASCCWCGCPVRSALSAQQSLEQGPYFYRAQPGSVPAKRCSQVPPRPHPALLPLHPAAQVVANAKQLLPGQSRAWSRRLPGCLRRASQDSPQLMCCRTWCRSETMWPAA